MRLAERDESLLTFVPQHQRPTPENLKYRKPADAAEIREIAQHEWQSVVGDTAAQMMDVVDADICGEPAQDTGQGIGRAATKRRHVQVPVPLMRPNGILELVLDIEQPDPDRGRKQHDWHMHEQKRPGADQPYHCGDESRDGGVGSHCTQPELPIAAHETDWQAVPHNEQIRWTEAEHDDRMTIDTVAQPTPLRSSKVLMHGQGVDITDSATV